MNWDPDTNAEIAQNVQIISRTRKGTQPLDRDLGIRADVVDAPGPRGQALFAAAIIDALPQQEPRVNVTRVAFADPTIDGQFSPTIEYEVQQ